MRHVQSIRTKLWMGCRPANQGTTLDGNQSGTVLALSVETQGVILSVNGMTFQNGDKIGNGGGLYMILGKDITVSIESIVVLNNRASINGGGVYVTGPIRTISLFNSIFNSNASDYLGGGVDINAYQGTVTFNKNTIKGNFSITGGGGVSSSAKNVVFTNNNVEYNVSQYGGGGARFDASSVIFNNNAVSANTSTRGGDGGGVCLYVDYGGTITFNNNFVHDNSITFLTPYGFGGGGVFAKASKITFNNNSVVGNTSINHGGGVYLASYNGIVAFANNSIVGNTSTYGGGGLYLSSGLMDQTDEQNANSNIFNNVFWENISDTASDFWMANDLDGDYLQTPISLLGNNFDQTPGTGYLITLPITIDTSNLNKVVPLFVDVDNENLNLQIGSPMINAGYPGTPDLPEFDIEGNPRIVGGRVDIGAYEYDDGTRYNLTTTVQGTGFGRVTSNPPGLDCGNACDFPFPPQNQVVLTANPDNGSTFTAWGGGGCSGTAPCTVTMDADKTVTATFSLIGTGQPALNAAVLPYARAVGLGETATAFGTLINSGTLTATNCSLGLPSGIPATFTYQTTDAGNALVGNPNTPASIPPGATQGFVFGITPTATFAATEIPLIFDCTNSDPAPSHAGVNTFILSASEQVPADLVAIASTVNNDGIVHLDPQSGVGFFAAAAVNIGSTGTITVSADDGERNLPITLEVCETTASGQRIGSCAASLSRNVAEDQTVYYTVNAFLNDGETIPFDPAFNRLFLRFMEGGTTVGATNVAVTTD